MGTKMGPSYANLFVGYIEHQFFNQYNGPKPDLYRRYIDDCGGATSSTREELNQFITAVNSFHPALKYTWEISDTSLAFLDIKVSVEGNGLCTIVHYKPIDSHSNRIPFTLTFHPHNHAVKSIILKNFKLLQNDPDTGRIFSQPPLISIKRDKNIGNFLVRSAFQTSEQPGTFKCARTRCKTCPFICNVDKLSGPKRSIIKIIL